MLKTGRWMVSGLAAATVTALVTIPIGQGPALAQQKQAITGIDKIHAQARFGNRVCMTSHRHYGEGTMPSRNGAEAAAIRAWQVFTADEYGNAWGSHALATNKSMKCSQSGGFWTCGTIAYPCRPAR